MATVTGSIKVESGNSSVQNRNQSRFPNTKKGSQSPEVSSPEGHFFSATAVPFHSGVDTRTDPLTGCANRRYFQELSEHEFARAQRYGSELSVLMLDLDHFKRVNDLYGHQAGDEALQRLVQACRSILRETDVIGRLGGEEFAIVLAETGSAEAFEVAERLRLSVAAAEVSMDGKPPLHLTVSIGVTSMESQDSCIDTVIRRADQAMYEAKDKGRDKVVVRRSSSIPVAGKDPQLLLFPSDSLGSR